MENKELDSGFKINNLVLVESSFYRDKKVSFNDESVDKIFNINAETSIKENVITVAVETVIAQKNKDIEEFKMKVRMIGVFECIGETMIKNFEEFGRVNGAAIIFPYIREHITNISSKAGIGAIILPPVNFTKMK